MTRSSIPFPADILHEIFKFVLFHKSINYEVAFKQLVDLAHVNSLFRSIVQSSLTLNDSNRYDYFGSNLKLFAASSPFLIIRESLIHVNIRENTQSNPEIAKSQALDVIIILKDSFE